MKKQQGSAFDFGCAMDSSPSIALTSTRSVQAGQVRSPQVLIGDPKNVIIEVLAYNIASFVPERAYFKKFIYA